MTTLNRDSLYSRKLLLPLSESTHLVLIGCGGTGSWLAPHLVRIAKLLVELHDRDVSLTFWDHDHVEPKNVYRQNFCQAEVGANKAATLAQRYGLAWGMNIRAIEQPFTGELPSQREFAGHETVYITCVDRNHPRREVARLCERYGGWWVDTGNRKVSGQVSVGRAFADNEYSPLRLPSVTTWLPLPSVQFPDILREEDEEQPETGDYSKLSCADLALVDEQGLSINHGIASASAILLTKMLVTNDLHYHCAYVSTEAGTSLVYNAPRILRKYLKELSNYRAEMPIVYDDGE
jgi:PRTRC genetic system ThiF family protein